MTNATLVCQNLQVKLGRSLILKGIDMQVRPGDLYGLLGRNGAGKTTTMRCVLGFLHPSGGVAQVFGRSSSKLHRVNEPIGVALDPPGLDESLTVRDNLIQAKIRGGIRSGRTVDQVLDLVGLTHRQQNRGNRLSHGQGRRAAVARALLGEPQLLVLDEPLSGLDPQGVETMLDLFRRLAFEEGVTVLFSSHHLREVQEVCNRVGLIEDGKVVLEGDTQRLLADAGDGLRVRCSPEAAATAQQKMVNYSGVSEVALETPGHLRARVESGIDLAPLLEELVQAKVGLQEFSRDRASLVDVFHQAVE